MANIDWFNLKQELVIFLRNQNVFTISTREVTTTTDTFSGDDSETEFDLAHTNVKNVRLVSVDSGAKIFGTDYMVDYEGDNVGRVTFSTPPAGGTDNISIQYDYGSNDRIFPDWPKNSLGLSNYPRIAVDVILAATEEIAIGGAVTRSDVTASMTAFANSTKTVDDLLTGARNAILNNKKNFYYFGFVSPISLSPIIESPDRREEILQRTQDFKIENIIEVV